MPGLSFIFDYNNSLLNENNNIEHSLQRCLHNSNYQIRYFLKNKHFILASTNYPEYPIYSYEDENYFVFLEGQIYTGYTSIKTKLTEIVNILTIDHNQEHPIENWLQKNDGDFIILFLDKKANQIMVINDALGRLPLYMYDNNNRLIISRELQFISNMIPGLDFNRMAIAQNLLFGYCLGERTILQDVFRALPCLCIKMNLNERKISYRYLHTYNFENKKHAKRSIQENATELEKIFCEACKYRFKTEKAIISLSGGLDSRSVVAALHKSKIPFKAVTRLSYNKKEQSDVMVAEEITKAVNINWSLMQSKQPLKGNDLLKIIKTKNGLNNISMSFMVPFLEKVAAVYGHDIVNYTGDGGFLLKDIKPVRKLKNINSLIKYTLHENQINALSTVTALTSVSEKDIINELIRHYDQYPESDLDNKYVHFFVFERSFRWLFEGEDRNRAYFWSVAPLNSLHFFNYALNCPDNQKIYHKLYREFLLTLSTDLALINNARWNAPIGSFKAKIFSSKNRLRRRYFEIDNFYKKHFKKRPNNVCVENSIIAKCIKELVSNCGKLDKYFDIEFMLNNLTALNKQQVDTLFTVLLAMELFDKGSSILDNYREKDFN